MQQLFIIGMKFEEYYKDELVDVRLMKSSKNNNYGLKF